MTEHGYAPSWKIVALVFLTFVCLWQWFVYCLFAFNNICIFSKDIITCYLPALFVCYIICSRCVSFIDTVVELWLSKNARSGCSADK